MRLMFGTTLSKRYSSTYTKRHVAVVDVPAFSCMAKEQSDFRIPTYSVQHPKSVGNSFSCPVAAPRSKKRHPTKNICKLKLKFGMKKEQQQKQTDSCRPNPTANACIPSGEQLQFILQRDFFYQELQSTLKYLVFYVVIGRSFPTIQPFQKREFFPFENGLLDGILRRYWDVCPYLCRCRGRCCRRRLPLSRDQTRKT